MDCQDCPKVDYCDHKKCPGLIVSYTDFPGYSKEELITKNGAERLTIRIKTSGSLLSISDPVLLEDPEVGEMVKMIEGKNYSLPSPEDIKV